MRDLETRTETTERSNLLVRTYQSIRDVAISYFTSGDSISPGERSLSEMARRQLYDIAGRGV